jgi:hypothetical protein
MTSDDAGNLPPAQYEKVTPMTAKRLVLAALGVVAAYLVVWLVASTLS